MSVRLLFVKKKKIMKWYLFLNHLFYEMRSHSKPSTFRLIRQCKICKKLKKNGGRKKKRQPNLTSHSFAG